jgi:hypothetical protein
MTRLPLRVRKHPKGEVAETGAAEGGVIVEAGRGFKNKTATNKKAGARHRLLAAETV